MHRFILFLPFLLILALVAVPSAGQTTRTVMIEEFTGTWCGYCPYGADTLAAILKDLSYARALSYHQGSSDTMTTTEGNQFIAYMNPAYPQAAIDRVLWAGQSKIPISRPIWRSKTVERSAETSPISISVTGEFDQYTRVMTANIHLDILDNMQGNFNLNVIVTQDGINQRQTFYPPSGGTVYLDPYYHLHVVRKMITGTFGKSLTTSGFAANDSRDTTITYTLPSWWVYNKLHLSVMVSQMAGSTSFLPLAQSFQEKMYAIFTTVPVQLVTFLARQVDRDVRLTWRTASESNNLGWEIERRAEKGEWSAVGFVPGSGTTKNQMSYEFIDSGVRQNTAYEYRLKQLDTDGTYDYSITARVYTFETPAEYAISQNYPNPFNPQTVILYSLPLEEKINITVFDNLGHRVKTLFDGVQQAGPWEVVWNGTNAEGGPVAAGTYYYTITTPHFTRTKLMTLVK